MPITPYTQPIQFEYKPLNLAAFAVPLAQMQEKFDVTQALINESDVDLSHLPYGSDPAQAEALRQTYREKRDELAKNLSETGNYTQAATKLKELNKLWQSDPEKQALEANYKLWQERDKAEKERIDSGKPDQITRDQYLQWRNKEIRNYEKNKGAGFKADYTNPSGKYNVITGQTGRLADLEDELQKLEWQVASAVPGSKVETVLQSIGIDTDIMDKHFRSMTIDETNAGEVARRTREYLLTQPKYKKWAEEVADYNFEDMLYSGNYPEYAKKIASNELNSIDARIANRERYLNNPQIKGDKNKDPKYQALLEEKEALKESVKSGEYDPEIIRSAYINQHVENIFDKTALGKVFAKKDISYEDTFRDLEIPDEDGGGGDGSSTKGGVPFFMPNEDMKFNTSSVKTNIHDNASKTRTYIKDAAKLSGGSFRTLLLGTDKKEREANGKNVGIMFPRMQIIQKAALNNVGNAKGFKNALKAAGIDVSNNDAVNRVFKDLTSSNSSAMRELDNAIQGGKKHFDNYVVAKNNLNIIVEATGKDDDFKLFAAEVGNVTPTNEGYERDESARLRRLKQSGQKLNSEEEKLVKIGQLFDANSYSAEQLAKIGLKKENVKSNVSNGFGFKPLTFNQVAKLKGYKDFKEALLKGYDFNGAKIYSDFSISDGKIVQNSMFGTNIEGSPQKVLGQFLQHSGNKGLKTQEMAHNLINDKQSQTELSQAFSTMDKALAYSGGKTFANLPGFDEQGNPVAGTNIDYNKNRVPLITTIKGDSFIQIPYKYDAKEYGGSGQGTLTMPVRPGNQDYIYSVYNRVDKKTKNSDDPLMKQTNATIKVAKFNQIHGNNFNDVYATSLKVSASEPEAVITTITIPDNFGRALNVELVKRHPGGGGNQPYYSIKFPENTSNGTKYMGRFKTPDALKQAVMEGE